MNSTLFSHSHDVDGEISLVRQGDNVKLSCRWPFDLASDEYIFIENVYRGVDYAEALRSAMNGKSARLEGINGGFLEITPRSGGFDLEFSNIGEGYLRKSLHLRLDGQLKDSFETISE